MTEATWPVVVRTSSPSQTRRLAGRLAGLCRVGDVVLLVGDLGAGKTVFAQGFAAALGVRGPVTSPTFALVRQYACDPGHGVHQLIHADVYRTTSVGEVADLALAELAEEDAVVVVEWGDLAAPALAPHALEVTLRVLEPEEAVAAAETSSWREVTLRGRGGWERRAGEVAGALSELGAPWGTK